VFCSVLVLTDDSSDQQHVNNITIDTGDILTSKSLSSSSDESLSYLPDSLSRVPSADDGPVTTPTESIYDRVGSLWTSSSFMDTLSQVDLSDNSIIRLPVNFSPRTVWRSWRQCGLELHTCIRPGFIVLISSPSEEYDTDYIFGY